MRIKIDDNYVRIANKIQSRAIVKTTYEQIKTAWRSAARAFFKEVAAAVAIDTGMSRATLLPLAAKVRIAADIRDYLVGSSGTKRGLTRIDGTYDPNGVRSIAQGISDARAALGDTHNIELGTPSSPYLIFQFEIVSYQWTVWENEWNAIAKGTIAFEETFELEIRQRLSADTILRFFETGNVINRGE